MALAAPLRDPTPAGPVAPEPVSPEPDEDDVAVLDAYSAAVSSVAETLIPSVASLRVTRQMGGWPAAGAGSAVAFTPDGYLVTSAHVGAGWVPAPLDEAALAQVVGVAGVRAVAGNRVLDRPCDQRLDFRG